MGDADKTILVTGATGRQGGAVIRHLLPQRWKLRAFTRNPNGHAAKQLSGQGVEIVQGDLEGPDLPGTSRARCLWHLQRWITGSPASGAK